MRAGAVTRLAARLLGDEPRDDDDEDDGAELPLNEDGDKRDDEDDAYVSDDDGGELPVATAGSGVRRHRGQRR